MSIKICSKAIYCIYSCSSVIFRHFDFSQDSQVSVISHPFSQEPSKVIFRHFDFSQDVSQVSVFHTLFHRIIILVCRPYIFTWYFTSYHVKIPCESAEPVSHSFHSVVSQIFSHTCELSYEILCENHMKNM